METDAIKMDLPCVSGTPTQFVLLPPAVYSQVKQKLYLTSKFLLFKVTFRLQHQGNQERVFLLWVMVKN